MVLFPKRGEIKQGKRLKAHMPCDTKLETIRRRQLQKCIFGKNEQNEIHWKSLDTGLLLGAADSFFPSLKGQHLAFIHR